MLPRYQANVVPRSARIAGVSREPTRADERPIVVLVTGGWSGIGRAISRVRRRAPWLRRQGGAA